MSIDTVFDESAFRSVDKLYRAAQEKGLKVTKQQIQEFLNKQEVHQLTRQPRKPKKYDTITSVGKLNNVQMDIMIYDRYRSGHYKYILCVIDVYSRYAFAVPLTSRQIPNILVKLDDIFKTTGYPKNINCDNEFNNSFFETWAKKHDVKMWYSLPDDLNKNAIVERFNRTLANGLQKYRTATKKYNWPEYLPLVVGWYNDAFHRTIQAKPVDVWEGKEISNQTFTRYKPNLRVGDTVRILLKKKVFDKGDILRYSKTVHTIESKEGRRFKVSNNDRLFKPYELIKVEQVEEKTLPKEEEQQHEKIQKQIKLDKKLKREGVEQQAILSSKRRIKK